MNIDQAIQVFLGAIGVFLVLGLAVLGRVVLVTFARAGQLHRLRENAERAASGPRDLDSCAAALLDGLPPGGPAAGRVEALLAMRRLGQSHPDATGLAALAEAEVHRQVLLPRALAGVLVLLGLCGAITGLLGVLPKVSELIGRQAALVGRIIEFQASQATEGRKNEAPKAWQAELQADRDALTREFSLAMDHMRPAFAASIAGIVSTILLMLGLAVTEGLAERRLLAPLEEITATRLVPLLTAPDDLGTLQEALKVLTGTGDYLSQLSDRMLDQAGQVEAQLSILYSVIHQFETGSKDLGRGHEEIRAAHESTLATVRQFQTLADALARDVGEGGQRNREVLARLDRALGALERLQDDNKLSRDSAAEGLQRVLGALQETQDRQFAEILRAQERQVTGLREGREHQAVQLLEAVRGLEARLGGLQTGTEEALARVRGAVDGVAPAVGSTLGEELGRALAPAMGEQARAVQVLVDEVGRLGRAAAALEALDSARSASTLADGSSLAREGSGRTAVPPPPPGSGDADLGRLVGVLERVSQKLDALAARDAAPRAPAQPGLGWQVGVATLGSSCAVGGLLGLSRFLSGPELAGTALAGLLAAGAAWAWGRR